VSETKGVGKLKVSDTIINGKLKVSKLKVSDTIINEIGRGCRLLGPPRLVPQPPRDVAADEPPTHSAADSSPRTHQHPPPRRRSAARQRGI